MDYKENFNDGYVMALNYAEINLMSLKVMIDSGSWTKEELIGQIDRMNADIKELKTEKRV